MKLEGKTAVVTGAAKGIGRAIALRFAEHGVRVAINDIDDENLKETVRLIEETAPGAAAAVVGDISESNVADRLFGEAIGRFGGVDIAVNNASWTTCSRHFMAYDDEFWDSIVKNNLRSVYLVSRRAAEQMAKKGEGAIISLSSIGATRAHREMVGYDACKGAIEAFTRATALDLAPWNIRVNAISPAVIVGTPVKPMDPEKLKNKNVTDFGAPLLRQGSPDDIAAAALFLASDASGFITGQVLSVDGGLSIQARPYALDKYPTVTPESFRGTDS